MPASLRPLPLISVVVPSLNQGRFLNDALESIFRQEYPHLEVLVVDGGSADDSVEVLRAWESRLAHWRSRPDDGQSAAINEGVERSRGDLVAWLNADDFYLGDSLWVVGRARIAHPLHGLYVGNGLRFRQADGSYEPFCRRHLALDREALRLGLDYVLQPATFFERAAWQQAGGLDESLCYCMDWDLLLRIAGRRSALLIDDFLAGSREHGQTKTSGGGMERAREIDRMVRSHADDDPTPGSLYYLLETLLDVGEGKLPEELRYHLYEGMKVLRGVFAARWGNADGFPERTDPGDETYVPIAGAGLRPPRSRLPAESLPSISVVVPSFNQVDFLERAIDSVLSQDYPKVEVLVIDGGSTDGSVDVLRRRDGDLAYWVSEPDRGPAHAINRGLERARGDVLGWLNSDDALAEDALWEIGATFVDRPDVDMVFANALYVDEHDRPCHADHGDYRTGLYFGALQPLERVPFYWSYVHAIPQPTTYFRRALLERCGPLDESYGHIFDFELFWRFQHVAEIKKIERTLAFYRIHPGSKTGGDWRRFLVEHYRFSRPRWPRLPSRAFYETLRDFVGSYMKSRFGARPRDAYFWTVASLVALSAVTRIGNPERWDLPRPSEDPDPGPADAAEDARRRREQRAGRGPEPGRQRGNPEARQQPEQQPGQQPEQRPGQQPEPQPGQQPGQQPERQHGEQAARRPRRENRGRAASSVIPADRRFRSVFCGFTWPRHPCRHGGEIRDYHLLRHLLTISDVEFFALETPAADDGRDDRLADRVEALHTPQSIRESDPDLLRPDALGLSRRGRLAQAFRRRSLPVVGPRYHADVAEKMRGLRAHAEAALRRSLERRSPDFLFVSPQLNPLALLLDLNGVDTRTILGSYDVEAVRMERLAASTAGLERLALTLEARRAARFESENVRRYDGILAVTALDKTHFVDRYGIEPDRVLVIQNGVDTGYFAFRQRPSPRRPDVVFVSSLAYPPNRQAAWRLIRQIMPRVRSRHPDAGLWIVGQQPGDDLRAADDGRQTMVTGFVDDVRPYLARAAVACVPLIAGSGIKNKILEAVSAGVPTVCTPLALEGMSLEPGRHVLTGDSNEEIAAAIVELLDHPGRADRLAAEGRRHIERSYRWEPQLRKLDDWLQFVADAPRRRAP